ncbi:MAG: FkbM family methyltransferase [Pyrinomonadaceae bacterium]
MMNIKEPFKKTAKTMLRKLGSDIVSKSKSDLARICEITTAHSVNIVPFVVKSMLNTGRPVNFMQIGANDGTRDDGFRHLILKYNFPGLLVEPQPRTFQDLLGNYEQQSNLIFENVAISPHKGDLTMHVFDRAEEKNLRLDVYTSTDRSQLEGAKARQKLQAKIERVVVPTATVDELLSKSPYAVILDFAV